MTFSSGRLIVLALLAASIGLLIPGLLQPVLTIRGVLKPEGVAAVAPDMLGKGLNDETVKTLKPMMNPGLIALIEGTGGDLRKTIVDQLAPQMVESLKKSAQDVEVYSQTRSILGSVKHLYEVKSPVPATLILLFSVIVPLGKAMLVLVAAFTSNHDSRRRVLRFVEAVAKWSMADVFAVALFIAFLAAQASQTPPGDPNAAPPLVAFTATFGSGFYWFAAYCLFSLASQQSATRLLTRADDAEAPMRPLEI